MSIEAARAFRKQISSDVGLQAAVRAHAEANQACPWDQGLAAFALEQDLDFTAEEIREAWSADAAAASEGLDEVELGSVVGGATFTDNRTYVAFLLQWSSAGLRSSGPTKSSIENASSNAQDGTIGRWNG